LIDEDVKPTHSLTHSAIHFTLHYMVVLVCFDTISPSSITHQVSTWTQWFSLQTVLLLLLLFLLSKTVSK